MNMNQTSMASYVLVGASLKDHGVNSIRGCQGPNKGHSCLRTHVLRHFQSHGVLCSGMWPQSRFARKLGWTSFWKQFLLKFAQTLYSRDLVQVCLFPGVSSSPPSYEVDRTWSDIFRKIENLRERVKHFLWARPDFLHAVRPLWPMLHIHLHELGSTWSPSSRVVSNLDSLWLLLQVFSSPWYLWLPVIWENVMSTQVFGVFVRWCWGNISLWDWGFQASSSTTALRLLLILMIVLVFICRSKPVGYLSVGWVSTQDLEMLPCKERYKVMQNIPFLVSKT